MTVWYGSRKNIAATALRMTVVEGARTLVTFQSRAAGRHNLAQDGAEGGVGRRGLSPVGAAEVSPALRALGKRREWSESRRDGRIVARDDKRWGGSFRGVGVLRLRGRPTRKRASRKNIAATALRMTGCTSRKNIAATALRMTVCTGVGKTPQPLRSSLTDTFAVGFSATTRFFYLLFAGCCTVILLQASLLSVSSAPDD